MTVSALRFVALALLTGTALLLGSAPAWAHTRLDTSDPADGSSLATGPAQVSLTFTEPVQPGFSTVTVVGPDGLDYRSGEPSAGGATVGTAVRPLGPAGEYRIGYRVVSADGHPISGSVAFTLAAPGPGAAAPAGTPPPAAAPPGPDAVPGAAPEGDGGGTPVWPWIVGAVVLVGGGVAAALRLGR